MAALISSVMNTKDRVPFYVNACDEMGIEVLPPDVNTSQVDFAVVEGKIRFGLNAVKNVGGPAARGDRAPRARRAGAFASIWDFTERVDPQVVNKRALESLVKCGALDSTGAPRQGDARGARARARRAGGGAQADRLAGQGSIFDLGDRAEDAARGTTRRSRRASSRRTSCCGWRRRRSASTSPSIRCRRSATSCAARPTARWPSSSARRDGEVVTVGGIVGAAQAADDEEGRADGVPAARRRDRRRSRSSSSTRSTRPRASCSIADAVLVVKGRVDHKEGETKLIALEVTAVRGDARAQGRCG